MRIISIITSLFLGWNTLNFLNHNPKKPNHQIEQSSDVFYSKKEASPINQQGWKKKYLENISYGNSYKFILDKIIYNNKAINYVKSINPELTIPNERSGYPIYVIINNEKMVRWSAAADTLKNGDEVIFIESQSENRQINTLIAGGWNTYCTLKDTGLKWNANMAWPIEIKYYKKGDDKLYSAWQPIDVPNHAFCNPNDRSGYKAYIVMNQDKFNVDISRPIKFGNMYFFDNKFRPAAGVVKVNKSGKILKAVAGDNNDNIIKIPYIKGSNVGYIYKWHSPMWRNYQRKINNPTPYIKGWRAGMYESFDPFKINDFIHLEPFVDKIIKFNHDDKEKIIKSIFKETNFFNFNVYDKSFLDIKIVWGEKTPNKESQKLTISMNDGNNILNYSYKVIYSLVVKENAKIQVKKQQKVNNSRRERQSQEEDELVLKQEKKKFEQNFQINYQDKIVKTDSKNPNFSFSIFKKINPKSKKFQFFSLLILVVFMGVIRKKW